MGETPTELYAGHAAELQRHAARLASIEAAASQALPGPLLGAFAHVPFELGGLRIRPVVHYDFVILTKLDSPLMKQLRGGEHAKTPFTDEEGYAMVWQFARPIRQVKAEIEAYEREIVLKAPETEPAEVARQVRERFAARAVDEIGLTLGILECGLLCKAVEREFLRSLSTLVNYQPKPAEGEQTFQTPPAAMTASVGGLDTSAV